MLMTTPPGENRLVTDPELLTELVRLDGQGEMLTRSMGGVLPELSRAERNGIQDVLDLACGPGEWVLQLVFENPKMHVVGVDISHRIINYANAKAQEEQSPATFQILDVLSHPLPFADGSFDLVNMRLGFSFLLPGQWPSLLAECLRLLRPGGLIRLCETERSLSNNAVFEKYMTLWTDTFFRDHRTFSPDGLHYGLLPMVKLLLEQAGFMQLRHVPYMIDVSANSPTHQTFFADMLALLQDGLPFLRRMARGPSELEELEAIYDQLRGLVNQEDFCAYWPLMTFLGSKPKMP
ncbi:class I SAM-dependent methyltransferase [Ktedonosporobacter rubrisoli]|nr:class I SAM-dependent methyltransferase [Ktedonosporobacter rubrisoli]